MVWESDYVFITAVEGEGEVFVLWRSNFDELESWLGGGRWRSLKGDNVDFV